MESALLLLNYGKRISGRCALCGLFLCASAIAQDTRAKPQFEVASVRPVAKNQVGDPALARVFREAREDSLQEGKIPMAGPDRVLLRDWSLFDLIAVAYSVRASQISGPAWLSDKSFDIEARVPDGTPSGELNAMLQSLLEERFALGLHRITRTKQGYAITMGKGGPKLTPAAPPSNPSRKLNEKEQESQLTQAMTAMQERIESSINDKKSELGLTIRSWPSITLDELAQRLERYTDAPVVDGTGLTGKYSVTIEISQNPDSSGNTIFDAVEQLGLKLEPRKVPIDILVVDQINQVPTAN